MTRRIERGRATRNELVSVARELFGKLGYDNTSIGAILARSGVARGALYHHFADKAALFEAVLEGTIADVASSSADAARAAPDPTAGLHAGCATWLKAALHTDVQRIVLIDAPAVVGWSRRRELDEQYTLGALRANLRRIAEQGRLPEQDVDVLAHMIYAAVSEASMLVAADEHPRRALRAARSAVVTLIDRLVCTDG
jgi:AcrR family transcriptional regulator